MATTKRTTHRSTTGTKLYAVRDSKGQFKDIQTYKRAHGADVRTHPTVVIARTDLKPPRVPARVTITDTDEAWRLRFRTLGEEVAFHAFKAGPPAETRCADATGYRLALDTLIQLPREVQRYRLCAIPYDAAQNPGALFERTLP